MRRLFFLFVIRLAKLAGVCLAALALGCDIVSAQDAQAPVQPLWMPRPSRYLDRPMTET